MATTTDFAILAPVPRIHLDSAQENNMKIVAFGTDCFDVFQTLDEKRGCKNGIGGEDVDVYIYASHNEGCDGVVTWKGRYVGFDVAVGGRHPDSTLRPPTTMTDTSWLLFWRVEDLAEIDVAGKAISALHGYQNKKPYGKNFPPRHPIIVKHPNW